MPLSTMTRARSMPLRLSASRQRAGLARSRPGRVLASGVVSVSGRARAVDQAVAQTLRPFTLPALRVLLGLLFVWFGGLKIVGSTPVAALIAQTLPFANQHLVLLVLGTAEVVLGAMLMSGVFVRMALPALAMHLVGTFSTFVVAPGLMFSGGNPLLLTASGEFVAKNVVLIAATLVLIAHTKQSAEPSSCTCDTSLKSVADLPPADTLTPELQIA